MESRQYSIRHEALGYMFDCRTVVRVFLKVNDMHSSTSVRAAWKGAGTPYRRVPSEKSTGIVANTAGCSIHHCVANVPILLGHSIK